MTMTVTFTAVLLWAVAAAAQTTADVRITHSQLQIACVDGADAGPQRKWKLPKREVSMTFTMRNQPRPGQPGAAAGFATITFTPEPAHTYEIEVRADAEAYSKRVWPKGEWRAVVRDRATDRAVSSEPQWSDSAACAAGRDRR